MVVIVANSLPDALRGKIKLWFVEPKPNVFVSGITDSLADRVVDLLMEKAPISSGLVIFKSISKAPHFRIYVRGATAKQLTCISGLQLLVEKSLAGDKIKVD
ncbi:MAG: type I-E CRISPR-associated endoribonuclease Cas2 [Lentisphaeria bacterium]|nr:type I-E CRISPR-associated endoribonuclease Cas2 [Lentisphaeria bacterium]